MTSLEEIRIGATPILKRLAYTYLTKGFGRHTATECGYDEVVVRELYPWKAYAENSPHAAGIRVEFHRGGKRVRWIEFGVRDIGAGGIPAVYTVPDETKTPS